MPSVEQTEHRDCMMVPIAWRLASVTDEMRTQGAEHIAIPRPVTVHNTMVVYLCTDPETRKHNRIVHGVQFCHN